MRHAINWFEIPTQDLDRATRFYEQVLGRELRREIFGGTPIAIFTTDGVAGALTADPRRKPSADGSILFLDASPDLDACLARVAKAGGQVLVPRTDIGDPGHIAVVRDSEGNHVGLHVER